MLFLIIINIFIILLLHFLTLLFSKLHVTVRFYSHFKTRPIKIDGKIVILTYYCKMYVQYKCTNVQHVE
jgi:hypothetical protein